MVKTCMEVADIGMFLPFLCALWPPSNSENKSTFICMTCSEQLDNLCNLHSHEEKYKIMHNQAVITKKCHICSKVLDDKSNLAFHEKACKHLSI